MTATAPRRRKGNSPPPPPPPPISIAPRGVEFGPPPPPGYGSLEIAAIGACALALSVAVILLLSGYFTTRDPALVVGNAIRIGQSFADQGDRQLALGMPLPHYDSDPPTSGAHVPAIVTHQFLPLTDNELLSALAAGDVVIEYGGSRAPAGLTQLARQTAGPFSAALAATGQAVILAPRPDTAGLIGLAWTRMVRVSSPGDALLRQFIQTWLGRGAPGSG